MSDSSLSLYCNYHLMADLFRQIRVHPIGSFSEFGRRALSETLYNVRHQKVTAINFNLSQLTPSQHQKKVGKKSSNEMKRYKFFMVDEKTNQFPTLFTHVSDISHSELPRLLHLPDMLPTTEYIRDDLGNKLYPMLSDRL